MANIKDQLKETIPCDRVFRLYYPDHWRREGNCVCPFHDDANASLQVDEKFAFCHAESKRWDIFDLYRERHGGGFRDAMTALAELIGISDEPLPEPQRHAGGNGAPRKKSPLGEIQATYDYVDEDGALLFQVVRFDAPPPQNKDFRQRVPNGAGSWTWKLGDTRRVLYRLPQVLENKGIFLVEGEKDADNLVALGLCATTSPQGAKKWDTLVEKWNIHLPLRDKHVTIIPDNDDAGRAHAEQVAEQIQPFASSVKVLELPGLPEKGDVSDFIEMHGDQAKDKLLELVAATRTLNEPEEEPAEPDPPIPDATNLTDMGNATRLARRFGRRIRHCSALGWMVYDGKRWLNDDTSRIQACAKEIARGLYIEGANEVDEERRRSMIRFALKCESASKITSMIQLLPSEPGIAIPVDSFDKDPWLFNCANGTVDLRTGKLKPHDPADMISKLSPYEYHPDATCDDFLTFFRSTQPDDQEMQDFIWRALGYAMTGITNEQVWFFLSGKGGNGKGTLLTAVSEIMGDYHCNTPADTFLEQRGQTGRNDLARLRGARLVTASEPEGKKFDPSVLKTFTGEDPISARFLYREYFDFIPVGKLFFSANKRPGVNDHSIGFWRRLMLMPFDQNFDVPGIKDKNLRDKHRATQYPGILAWLVRGCMAWQERGLDPPAAIVEAVADYKRDTDPLGDFFESHCTFGPKLMVGKRTLWEAYSDFLISKKLHPKSYGNFNTEIASRAEIFDPKTRKMLDGHLISVWQGVALRDGVSQADSPVNCDICDNDGLCENKEKTKTTGRCQYYLPKPDSEQAAMYEM